MTLMPSVNEKMIEIVGVIAGTAVPVANIRTVLKCAETPVAYGTAVTGRLSTRAFTDGEFFIKLRTEYPSVRRSAKQFVDRTLDTERRVVFHHPSKTWFLLSDEGERAGRDDAVVVANITNNLKPINQIIGLDETSTKDSLRMLQGMIDRYLDGGASHHVLLDLSTSNFGIDSENHVYYLDDEFYDWDNFRSFAALIANILRSQRWLDAVRSKKLGQWVAKQIVGKFQDFHWCQVVAEDLRSKFVADDCQQSRDGLVEGLLAGIQHSTGNHRTSIVRMSFARAVPERDSQTGTKGGDDESKPRQIALLADVHANAPALEAVLAYLHEQEIHTAVVLGDIVGYGPHPAECIEMMRAKSDFHIVKGNHDHAAATGFFGRGFSAIARWVLEWTVGIIDDASQEWLNELNLYLQGPDWYAVHGAPVDRTFFNAYVYEMTYKTNLDYMSERDIRFCFHGHTHVQSAYIRNREHYVHSIDRVQDTSKGSNWLVCPGSIGQPRSGQGGAQFALLDIEREKLTFQHVPYDVSVTLKAMERSGFPSPLIDRLRYSQA